MTQGHDHRLPALPIHLQPLLTSLVFLRETPSFQKFPLTMVLASISTCSEASPESCPHLHCLIDSKPSVELPSSPRPVTGLYHSYSSIPLSLHSNQDDTFKVNRMCITAYPDFHPFLGQKPDPYKSLQGPIQTTTSCLFIPYNIWWAPIIYVHSLL